MESTQPINRPSQLGWLGFTPESWSSHGEKAPQSRRQQLKRKGKKGAAARG